MAPNPNPAPSTAHLEDGFIKITFEEDHPMPDAQSGADPFYDPWIDQASNKFASPATFGARYLHKLYPKHSVVLTSDTTLNPLHFPGAISQPFSPSELITNLFFIPLARHQSPIPGVLVDSIRFGSFKVAWDKYDFLLYIVVYPIGFGETTQMYILHEGPEDHARNLLVAAGAWADQLHDEILVFNQQWYKDHNLWIEVQKANWDEVILKDKFKSAIKKDIYGFFDSEDLYKSLAIPWKRGLIMYGPPGNGKTISLKAIMKDCSEKGYAPLYVKSFQSWAGEEAAMAQVFGKARQMAPCVVILEDLDALINDRNRSFFLNQLDGLEGNDGLLVVGTTNHFDRLDPALNSRPSRFDRKYLFDDPDEEERKLYVQFWQNKLEKNKSIAFPDSLVKEIVAATDKFSFAYLKEAFVSTLVLLAGYDGDDKPEFSDLLKEQVKALRDQLDKDKDVAGQRIPNVFSPVPPSGTSQPTNRGVGPIDARMLSQTRIWDTSSGNSRMPGTMPSVQAVPAQQDAGRTGFRGRAVNAWGRSFAL